MKIEKCRTKPVANRPFLFGISFNSRKKRDFFPSLFLLNRLYKSQNESTVHSKDKLHQLANPALNSNNDAR